MIWKINGQEVGESVANAYLDALLKGQKILVDKRGVEWDTDKVMTIESDKCGVIFSREEQPEPEQQEFALPYKEPFEKENV